MICMYVDYVNFAADQNQFHSDFWIPLLLTACLTIIVYNNYQNYTQNLFERSL